MGHVRQRPASIRGCYWLSLLGLITGARLEELCQLPAGDFIEQGFIRITDSSESQCLKNSSSRRVLPPHLPSSILACCDSRMSQIFQNGSAVL